MDRDLVTKMTIKINNLYNEKTKLSGLVRNYRQNFYAYSFLRHNFRAKTKEIKTNEELSEQEKRSEIANLENSIEEYKVICRNLKKQVAEQTKKVKQLEEDYEKSFAEFEEILRQERPFN